MDNCEQKRKWSTLQRLSYETNRRMRLQAQKIEEQNKAERALQETALLKHKAEKRRRSNAVRAAFEVNKGTYDSCSRSCSPPTTNLNRKPSIISILRNINSNATNIPKNSNHQLENIPANDELSLCDSRPHVIEREARYSRLSEWRENKARQNRTALFASPYPRSQCCSPAISGRLVYSPKRSSSADLIRHARWGARTVLPEPRTAFCDSCASPNSPPSAELQVNTESPKVDVSSSTYPVANRQATPDSEPKPTPLDWLRTGLPPVNRQKMVELTDSKCVAENQEPLRISRQPQLADKYATIATPVVCAAPSFALIPSSATRSRIQMEDFNKCRITSPPVARNKAASLSWSRLQNGSDHTRFITSPRDARSTLPDRYPINTLIAMNNGNSSGSIEGVDSALPMLNDSNTQIPLSKASGRTNGNPSASPVLNESNVRFGEENKIELVAKSSSTCDIPVSVNLVSANTYERPSSLVVAVNNDANPVSQKPLPAVSIPLRSILKKRHLSSGDSPEDGSEISEMFARLDGNRTKDSIELLPSRLRIKTAPILRNALADCRPSSCNNSDTHSSDTPRSQRKTVRFADQLSSVLQTKPSVLHRFNLSDSGLNNLSQCSTKTGLSSGIKLKENRPVLSVIYTNSGNSPSEKHKYSLTGSTQPVQPTTVSLGQTEIKIVSDNSEDCAKRREVNIHPTNEGDFTKAAKMPTLTSDVTIVSEPRKDQTEPNKAGKVRISGLLSEQLKQKLDYSLAADSFSEVGTSTFINGEISHPSSPKQVVPSILPASLLCNKSLSNLSKASQAQISSHHIQTSSRILNSVNNKTDRGVFNTPSRQSDMSRNPGKTTTEIQIVHESKDAGWPGAPKVEQRQIAVPTSDISDSNRRIEITVDKSHVRKISSARSSADSLFGRNEHSMGSKCVWMPSVPSSDLGARSLLNLSNSRRTFLATLGNDGRTEADGQNNSQPRREQSFLQSPDIHGRRIDSSTDGSSTYRKPRSSIAHIYAHNRHSLHPQIVTSAKSKLGELRMQPSQNIQRFSPLRTEERTPPDNSSSHVSQRLNPLDSSSTTSPNKTASLDSGTDSPCPNSLHLGSETTATEDVSSPSRVTLSSSPEYTSDSADQFVELERRYQLNKKCAPFSGPVLKPSLAIPPLAKPRRFKSHEPIAVTNISAEEARLLKSIERLNTRLCGITNNH
ncbi:unnamed protein product [Calicophoron daubneyi]|uniref:Uncharacterized protein n=1 Tax=Calicophoron daubneyi TaxID=300641 RepID=A0AAV2TJI3_CALDB